MAEGYAAPAGRSLEELKKHFDDFRSTMQNSRKQCAIDDDYYHGKQLTTEEIRVINARGQPTVVENRIRIAVNGVTGMVANSKTEPRCWPRTPNDDDSASVATDILRYVADRNHFHKMKGECARDYLTPGTAAVMVVVDDGTKDVKILPIRWEEYYYDPRSRRIDFSDRRYDGVAKWMYLDDMRDNWPEKMKGVDDFSGGGGDVSGAQADDTFDDRPVDQKWVDPKFQRAMVCEEYYKLRGRWMRCVYWREGILEEGESPYHDDRGVPENPIIPVSCYIDRDNNRYGIVRDMRDLQDEVNKRRSKLLHIANSSQIQARDPSAIEVNADEARVEAAKPDGVIPYGWEKVPQNDAAQGQAMLLSEAKAEMERFGPNPAVLGRQGADTSGRALLARQQAGLIEFAMVLGQLDDWELRVYKASWHRVKQFWDAQKIIRVTDDQDDPKFVTLNEPQMGMAPGTDPATGQPAMMQQVLGYKNNVAEMDVDITIDTTPATPTIMQEQLQDLMQLMGTNPQYAQQVPFEVVVGLMQIPRKRQLMKQIAQYRDKNAQAQAQAQAQQVEMMVKEAMAKIAHTNSQTMLNTAKADKLGADKGETVARIHKLGIDASNETAQTVHEVTQEPKEPASGA